MSETFYGVPSDTASEVLPALKVEGLSKSFSGNLVLESFDLSLEAGEIHVLVGQNGSGKSTLVKILSGYHEPDPGGHVQVAGNELHFSSPGASYRVGLRFVHQTLGLVPNISIIDNFCLSAGYPTAFGTIQTRNIRRAAQESLQRVGVDADVDADLSVLGAAERTGVAIARALRVDSAHPARVLILDEPTAALPFEEVNHVLDMLRAAAASGVAVLLITHHLNEVFRLADAVTVLRDGQKIGTFLVSDITRSELVPMVMGKEIQQVNRQDHGLVNEHAVILQVRGLSGTRLRGITFHVSPGEIVGIAGLTGSGRESILATAFGAIPATSGAVIVHGRQLRPGRPDASMRAGLAFLPADRAAQGAVMNLSAADNFSLSSLAKFWHRWRILQKRESAAAREWFGRLQVRPSDAVRQPLVFFSGGNQQKVLLAKWMMTEPSVMLLDEPTQGVDVGSQAEIHRQLLEMAGRGVALIISSSDLEELSAICTRILVLRDGIIIRELHEHELDPDTIMTCILSEAETEV